MGKVIKGEFGAKNKVGRPAKAKESVALYQLKISLRYCRPPIWRRLQVPASMSLAGLHDVIQLSMGWTDSHLHHFIIGGALYGPAELGGGWGGPAVRDERSCRLADLEAELGKGISYEYDLGDSWLHSIKLEKVIPPAPENPRHPVLLGGKRACPPEDIGGVGGYEDLLAALSDPDSEEHAEMLDWYGGEEFDPEYFDLVGINGTLKRLK